MANKKNYVLPSFSEIAERYKISIKIFLYDEDDDDEEPIELYRNLFVRYISQKFGEKWPRYELFVQ